MNQAKRSLTPQSQRLGALTPFNIGGTEILLVPSEIDGTEPTVLVVARHGTFRIADHVTPAQMRRLAACLLVAVDEAETLAALPNPIPKSDPRC